MPSRSPQQLREDALAIWLAGVRSVRSERLISECVKVEGNKLYLAGHEFDLREIGRIVVVGGGKAGAGMACALEEAFGPRVLFEKRVEGWVNVPADCVRETATIHLHPARAAGKNEPTTEGVAGTARILELVGALGPTDLCICLLSGGGSALLPAPIDGVSLADKLLVTQHLSAAGANIRELNTVRKKLSRIKGGGLARHCNAGTLVSLIISDVLGDPLDVIASGPTEIDTTTKSDALAVLARFDSERRLPDSIYRVIENASDPTPIKTRVINEIIGNLAVAVDAAGIEAERRGYSHAMIVAREMEGFADDIGQHLGRMAMVMSREDGPDCLITGGEPVVKLAPSAIRGLGGRNQQLVLAALQTWQQEARPSDHMVLLSGGTDGEDGPTSAAGALIDSDTLELMKSLGLRLEDYLARNDAYRFFDACDLLLRTGPTHTNVCDIRVVVVSRET